MDPKLNRVIIKVIAAALTIVGLASAQTQYTMKRLAFSGGLSSTSTAINRAGQVIGLADNGSAQRGFFYDGAVMHDLGALPGGTRATPKALNNKGWVVGLSDVGGSTIPHVFLYQPPPDGSGLLQDLGTFGGSLLITPVGITDSGRIAEGDMCPSFARLPAAEARRGMRLADHLPQSCPGSGWERAHCANRLPPKAADRNVPARMRSEP